MNKHSLNNKNLQSLIEIIVVLSCIIMGIFIRFNTLNEYTLGGDETFHLDATIYKGFSDFIYKAYSEVHPPLQFIIMNLAYKISPTRMSVRMVSLIVGILLMCYSYYLVRRKAKNIYPAIFTLVVLSFGYEFVSLSQGTRSYNLMMLFCLIQFSSLLDLAQSYSQKRFILFIVAGFCALTSDYSSISIVFGMNITFIYLYRNKLLKKHLVCIFTHILITAVQFILVKIYSPFHFSDSNYKNNYIKGFLDFLSRFTEVLTNNFFNEEIFSFFILFLIFLALFGFRQNKEHENYIVTLNFIVITVLFVAFHYLNLYPIISGRYSIIFSLIFFLSLLLFIKYNKFINIIMLIFSVFLIFFHTNKYFSNSECGYIINRSYYSLGYRTSELNSVHAFLKNNHSSKNDYLFMNISLSWLKFKDEFQKREIRKHVSNIRGPEKLTSSQTKDILLNKRKIFCVDCDMRKLSSSIRERYNFHKEQVICGRKKIVLYTVKN